MTAARSPKRQRMLLAAIAAVVLLGAGGIALFTLKDSATYFYAPADLSATPPEAGRSFRLGGLVKEGSVHRSDNGLVLHFVVTDFKAETPVSYRGIVPDLFREKQGVIATGTLASDGEFRAEELLAKHDEKYMPPEVARAVKGQLERTQPLHPSAA